MLNRSSGQVRDYKRHRAPLKQAVLLVALVILFLAGCAVTPDNSLADRSFITNQPCAPPCWYGLELEKSNREDVLATLKKLPFVDPTRIKEERSTWFEDRNALDIIFSCVSPPQGPCGEITLSEDKLMSLSLPVGYDLTFEMAIQQLGVPEYVDYSILYPEGGGSSITLEWPTKRIAVEHADTHSMDTFHAVRAGKGIPRNLKVTAIYYSTFTGPGPQKRIPWPGFQQ